MPVVELYMNSCIPYWQGWEHYRPWLVHKYLPFVCGSTDPQAIATLAGALDHETTLRGIVLPLASRLSHPSGLPALLAIAQNSKTGPELIITIIRPLLVSKSRVSIGELISPHNIIIVKYDTGLQLLTEMLPRLPVATTRTLLSRYGVRGHSDESTPLLLYILSRHDIYQDHRNLPRLIHILQMVPTIFSQI